MDQATADRVIGQVDEQETVELAGELIKIPSFKTQETPVARFLADYFEDRGYDVELQEVEPGRCQTIATLKGSGGKSLMLNGHTDINSLSRRWQRDPWTPSVEGHRLYGHGVQNMKGGLASIIMAAEAIRRAGVQLKGDLVVACVVGETQGGEGTRFLVENGPRTDMAVVAEPFGLGNLATVHAGIVHMAVHVYGVTGHIGQTEGTVNAVQKMTEVVQALREVEFEHTPREDLPALPRLNVGSIIGGRGEEYVLTEPSYIPDLCTIMVDVHFVPGQTVDSIVADVRRVLEPLRADPELEYEIEIPPPDYFEGRRRLVMDPLDVADRRVHRPIGCQESRACNGTAARGHRGDPPQLLFLQRHLPSVEGGHPLLDLRPRRHTRRARRGRRLRDHQRDGRVRQSAGPDGPGGVQSG